VALTQRLSAIQGLPACDLSLPPVLAPLSALLAPERIVCLADISSKKRGIEKLSELLLQGSPPPNDTLKFHSVFESLLNRERLGSTGLVGGVAIPHARLEPLSAPRAAFISLRTPIDYGTLDDAPVDLLFALLVPESAYELHLQLLGQLAETLRDPALLNQLRTATHSAAILALFTPALAHAQEHAA
jgi:PTS system nitrogen regulatory IIA component